MNLFFFQVIKFLNRCNFDKTEIQNEIKRINTDYNLKMADVKKQRQLDATNSKFPKGLTKAPQGRPPVAGAQWFNGGWIMPRLKKPVATTIKPETQKVVFFFKRKYTIIKLKPSINPLSREFLAQLRENIYANNSLVANGKYSKNQRTEPYKFVIAIQVHSR